MLYYIAVILVFLLYIVYDINSLTINNVILSKLFMIGSIILLVVNITLFSKLVGSITLNISTVIFMLLAVLFFILLIYTLFFSLPFKDTYVDEEKSRKVVKTGMYSLSRHIGVLWFILMYVCLTLVFQNHIFTIFSLISCLMNLIYILFQDNYSFIKLFDDYDEYKKEVSFLIPSINSIKKFVSKRGKR